MHEEEMTTEQVLESEAAPEQEAKPLKKEKKKDKRTSELDELKRQNAEYADRYVRTLAEFDNFRKRTAKEKSSMYDDGTAAAVVKFLPVLDAFERALSAVCGDDTVKKGMELILRQFKDALSAIGVTETAAAGKPFDPNMHEAVMMVEEEGYESGTVIEEMMKGYVFKDRPIRHSMVKVAK